MTTYKVTTQGNSPRQVAQIDTDNLDSAYDWFWGETINGADTDVTVRLKRGEDVVLAFGWHGVIYRPSPEWIIHHQSDEVSNALMNVANEYSQTLAVTGLPIDEWLIATPNPFALIQVLSDMGVRPDVPSIMRVMFKGLGQWLQDPCDEEGVTIDEIVIIDDDELINALVTQGVLPINKSIAGRGLELTRDNTPGSMLWSIGRIMHELQSLRINLVEQMEYNMINSEGAWQQLQYVLIKMYSMSILDGNDLLNTLRDIYPLDTIEAMNAISVHPWLRSQS